MSETVGTAVITELGEPITLRDSGTIFLAEPSAVATTSRYLFVADAGSGSIIQYQRDGTVIRRIGRRGRGPSDLAAPSAIVSVGDSIIIVADAGNRRVIVFGADSGEFRGSRQLRSNPFSLSASGAEALLGTYDPTQQHIMTRISIVDTTAAVNIGPVLADYVNSARARFA